MNSNPALLKQIFGVLPGAVRPSEVAQQTGGNTADQLIYCLWIALLVSNHQCGQIALAGPIELSRRCAHDSGVH
jgi:hypothetical protein